MRDWMKRIVCVCLAVVMLLGLLPMQVFAVEADLEEQNTFKGKTVSILSHSMSTYAGVSNSTAANSTLGNNDVYYTEGRHDVYLKDTWWQQTIDALDMELLVNNSWSGSCVFQPRKGEASVGYGDRAVNLHNDYTGEEPDVIFVYLGCNDFAYYKDTFGKADDVNYTAIIQENGDGTFTYATPNTTCEAYAIMLHKAANRYPDAEIYCITSTARRETDYTGDSAPDAGQPTEYSAQLQQIAKYYGYPVIDLENAIAKDVEIFDKYMGDKRAHANALGMDQITNEVLSVLLGKDAQICHVTSADGTVQEQAVLLGGSYNAAVRLQDGHAVVVTMNGVDITQEAFTNGQIIINDVTGDIEVHTIIHRDPQSFRWELQQDALVSVGTTDNAVKKLAGTITNGVLSNCRYELTTSVVLKHDLPWKVEWQFGGNWRGCVFTSDPVQSTKDMVYLSRTVGGQLCIGTWTGKQYDNYGVDLSGLNDQVHTYRLENRISTDGSNMVWVYVDGEEIGPMNRYFIGSKDQGKTSDWICGKDFVFSYISMDGHALRECKLNYLQVQECVHTHAYTPTVTAPTCTEQGYTTYTCACGDSYVDDHVDAVGHSYENGVCSGCGDECSTFTLRYDDHYDVSGKTVEILDAGKPTSYQVGYGVEENKVLDTAVVTLDGDTLVATGIGTATVKIDGVLYEVSVSAAPISLLLLAGQSNMQGSEGDENQSIVCPDGMVYATYGDRYTMTTSNATNFAPSALTGIGSSLNVNGTTTNLEEWPIYLLNESGVGKKGPDSGFAYEWVKQTGEKVWIVNAAHGGSSINTWQKTGENYKEALALFTACQETLRKEIAAGHYTLSHMGYFWCQGCTDYSQTAEWYVNKYLTMHENFKTQMAFDHDSDPSTDAYTFEFGGIIPVRAGNESYISYRQGVYADTTSKKYYESFKDLRFTGPRVAQYWMTNNPDLPDIWNVCNIGEDWVWMPDGTNGVTKYFQSHYPNGTVDYTTQVQQSVAWYTPTTPAAVHDSIHYNQIGYNEVGREAARNALIMLGEIEAPEVETSVEFLGWDGYTEVSEISAATAGSSATLVVPKVYPLWMSKQVTYELSAGLTWKYYDLLADSPLTTGSLKVADSDATVTVLGRELNSYRWDLESGKLISTGEAENNATLVTGSVESNVFSGVQYRLEQPFVLLHDQNWILEWKMTGPWYGESTTSQKLFCQDGASATTGAMCLLIKGNENRITIGYYRTNTHVSYGLDLDNYGISMADTHIYRLANHINDDGSNTIYLFVDGKQIAPMTHYFTGAGGAMGEESDYLSGKDISFGYLGTPKYLLNNGVIAYISVVESGATSNIHFHDWSDWEVLRLPGKDGPGEQNRTCHGCGETETQIVNSIWQTTNILQHWNELPETICGELNLWAVLEHDPKYYVNSKGDWDYHSSKNVPSVTFAVNPGDRIYATSFGAAKQNGHGSSNGIRLTFFDINGVVKTTDPAGTYAEFVANGGYIVVPEGAIAVNIPMWNNSDENEIYILNREHTYTAAITAPTCTEQGYTTYTCACGDSYVSDYTDPRPLNILMIGNSFSWDAADFWYDMQTSMTYDAMKSMMADPYDVHLAVMYKGSATLAYHATCAMKNTSAYTYTEIGPETNYQWTPSSGTNATNNILDQLEARDWDIIVIQSYQHEADGTEPRSSYTGGDARFTEPEASVGYLLDYFAEHEPNADVYYYMPWATTKFYGSDTETGYHAMAKYTETTVPNLTGTNSGKSFAGIIPVGTGIQNARTTYFDALRFSSGTGSTALLKDPQNGLQYDSQHLSFGLGRYIAGIIVAETLIPQEMRKDSYVLPTVKNSPAVGELPQEYSVIGQLAAKYALQDPFKLTTLADYDTELADRVCDAIKTADYSVDGIAGEADLKTHVESVVLEKLENMGAAEYSVTIHSFTLENGQIADMEATVTLRVGYTSRSVEIIVTNGMAHPFGEWEIIAVPSAEGPGLNRRVCKICGFVEEVAVDGSWQKFALAEHMQELPDDFCSETNLWDLLEPEKLMINHLGEWVSAGSSVYSVTIPVKPGEKIYANSFDQTDGRKGIQVSFIGDYGIVKTTFSSQTYKEFQANGGYLIAPEGTIAVNIPVWNVNADNNTIYFLDYSHTYTPAVTPPTCTEQGYMTHTCTACGDSYVDSYVDALGHSFGAWVVTTKPTCTEKGTERRDCGACEHFEEREVATTGHDYKAVVTEPTCTAQGYTTHICHCGDSYVDTYVAALGHDMGEWYVVKEATAYEDGEERRDCGCCEHYETRSVHIDVLWGDATDDGIVNGRDLVLLRQYLTKYDYETESSTVTVGAGCDANGDGVINGRDLVLLRQYLAGVDSETGESTVVLGPRI